MKDKTFIAILVVASLVVKIPIVLFFLQGFGIDESLYLATARDYAETGVFGVQTEFNDFRFIAPLLAFVMSGFYKVFGESGSLIVTPIVGSLTIIPFFYLGKMIFGPRGGRIAAVLALLNPVFFLLNTRILTESLGLLLFTTSALLFMMALKERKYWTFVLPLTFLTFIARYPYGFFLVAFFIIVLIYERKPKALLNYNFLAGIILALVIAAPWALFNYQEFGHPLGGPLHQGSTDPGFDYTKSSWYVPYLFMATGATFPFMIYGLLTGLRDRKFAYISIGFFTVFLLLFFVFGMTVEERYILPILPFAVIFTIHGYNELLKSKVAKRYARYAMVALLILNVVAAWYVTSLFSSLPKYSDTDSALEWAKENCSVVMGNLFTPVYHKMGIDVLPVNLNSEENNNVLSGRNVDCVIVSLHESPYRDFFVNEAGAEKFEFGKVFVYKIPTAQSGATVVAR